MRLEVTVGEAHPRQIVCTWDQMWGKVLITVDGEEVFKTRQTMTFDLQTDWSISGGGDEPHVVTFRKTRPLFVSGFRPQTLTVFVDGVAVAQTSQGLERRNIAPLILFGVIVFGAAILAAVALFWILDNVVP